MAGVENTIKQLTEQQQLTRTTTAQNIAAIISNYNSKMGLLPM